MSKLSLENLFGVKGMVAVITGGGTGNAVPFSYSAEHN